MPLGTLDRNPQPFFKQGTSALTKLIIFSFLSMALMLADQRYNLVQPARWVLSIIIYPVQWVALRPQVAWYDLGDVFEGKQDVLELASRQSATTGAIGPHFPTRATRA
jgi:rod shape-determining protein MreC